MKREVVEEGRPRGGLEKKRRKGERLKEKGGGKGVKGGEDISGMQELEREVEEGRGTGNRRGRKSEGEKRK